MAGLDEFLDAVTVLPPGEWDPSIRIEPPSSVSWVDWWMKWREGTAVNNGKQRNKMDSQNWQRVFTAAKGRKLLNTFI